MEDVGSEFWDDDGGEGGAFSAQRLPAAKELSGDRIESDEEEVID